MSRKSRILSRLLIPCILVSLLGLFSFPVASSAGVGDFRITNVEIVDSRTLLVTLNEEMTLALWDQMDQQPTFHARYFAIRGGQAGQADASLDGRTLSSFSNTYVIGCDDHKSFEIFLGSGATFVAGRQYTLEVTSNGAGTGRPKGQTQVAGLFWQNADSDRIDLNPVPFSSNTINPPLDWGIASVASADTGFVTVVMTQRVVSGIPKRTNNTGNFSVNGFNTNYVEHVPGGNGRVFRVYLNGSMNANGSYTLTANNMSGPYGNGGKSIGFTAGAGNSRVGIESAKAVESADSKRTEIWVYLTSAVSQPTDGNGGWASMYELPVSGVIGAMITKTQLQAMFTFSGIDLSGLGEVAAGFENASTIVIRSANQNGITIADGATIALKANAFRGRGAGNAANLAGAPVPVNVDSGAGVYAPGYDPNAADYLNASDPISFTFRHFDYNCNTNGSGIQTGPNNVNYGSVGAEATKVYVVENKYIKATFAPEYGGRMLSLIYKPTGHDLFYLNENGTPYGINNWTFRLGWLMVWGGVFPTFSEPEHGYYWHAPFSYSIQETADYWALTETITDNYGNNTGLKLTVTYTVYKDKAYVDMAVKIDNNTGSNKNYEYWTCTTLAPGEDTYTGSATGRIVSAVDIIDCTYGWMQPKEAAAPSGLPGAPLGGNPRTLNNLEWFRNWDQDGIGYGRELAYKPQADWWGVVNQSNLEGVIRVGNNKVTPGMKFWLWPYGRSFETRPFTGGEDSARPYIELWAGVSNQFNSKASIGNGQTVSWTETWMPTAGLNFMTNATKNGAAQVKFEQNGSTYIPSAEIFSNDFGKPMTAILFNSSGAILAREDFVPDPLSNFTIRASSGVGAGQTVAVAVYHKGVQGPVVTAYATQGIKNIRNAASIFNLPSPIPFEDEPVDNITGVPTDATVGVPLALTGTVEPAYATNRNIEWSIADAGTTGAALSGNILTAAAPGTVTVKATIIDGLLDGGDFVKTFPITVNPFIAVTDIIGVDIPMITTMKKPLTLTGAVVPGNAALQSITWSVKDAGGTGASVNGNILGTTNSGVMYVTATVKGGLGNGADFTKDFMVLVNPIVTVDGEIISIGKPAYSSSNESADYLPGKATNGDYTAGGQGSAGWTNRWASQHNVDPSWIYIDLEDFYNIDKVAIYWQNSFARTWTLQVSDDGVNWTPINIVQTTNSGGASVTVTDGRITGFEGTITGGIITNPQVVTFDPVVTRYVRMYGTQRNTQYGYSLFEFDVYGSSTEKFIPVTDIVCLPSAASAGVPLTLTGIVFPTVSTNADITWNVVSAGGTGAAINGDVLTAASDGTVTLRATVADGEAEGSDFTKTFSIAVGGPASGVSVTGRVKTYNPGNPTTLKLMQGAEEKRQIIIGAEAGFGQVTQDFAFAGVEAGTYTLVITKDAHTSFTAQTVIVGDTDLDLTQDSRDAVKVMTLLCGDINGDQMINDNDLIVLWQAANYNKSAGQASNPLCDLNGDGVINDNDLIILWLAVNYNKGPVVVG